MHPLGSRFAAATAITLLALTACSSDPAPEPTATVEATEPAELTETTPAEPETLTVADLGGKNDELGIIPAGPASDIHGEYTTTTLAADSPLLTWSGPLDPALEPLGAEAVQQAVATSSTFLIENGIDQPLLFDDSEDAVTAFRAQVLDSIEPWHRDDAYEDFDEHGDSLYSISAYGEWMRNEGLTPVYDGGVRYALLTAEITDVTDTEAGGIRVNYRLSLAAPVMGESGPRVIVWWVRQGYALSTDTLDKVSGGAHTGRSRDMSVEEFVAYQADGALPEGVMPEDSTELEFRLPEE